MNSGPEQGGTTAGITVLNTSAILTSIIPAVDPLSAGAPSPMAALPVANPIAIPGGVTAAVSDGTNLYLSGQSLNRLNLDRFSRHNTGDRRPLHRLHDSLERDQLRPL